MEGYVTTTEAAERLGVSSARVRQLVADGTLPAQKFGPVNMIKVADLEIVKNRPGVGRPPRAGGKRATGDRAKAPPVRKMGGGKRAT